MSSAVAEHSPAAKPSILEATQDEIQLPSPDKQAAREDSDEAGSSQAADAPAVNESIELSRRAVELPTVEPDVCAICLDPFTDDDPANSTQCGCVCKD